MRADCFPPANKPDVTVPVRPACCDVPINPENRIESFDVAPVFHVTFSVPVATKRPALNDRQLTGLPGRAWMPIVALLTPRTQPVSFAVMVIAGVTVPRTFGSAGTIVAVPGEVLQIVPPVDAVAAVPATPTAMHPLTTQPITRSAGAFRMSRENQIARLPSRVDGPAGPPP